MDYWRMERLEIKFRSFGNHEGNILYMYAPIRVGAALLNFATIK